MREKEMVSKVEVNGKVNAVGAWTLGQDNSWPPG